MRVHVLISGVVQGVFFRATTQNQALKLGLNGWVRNKSSGQVEAVFEGPKERVEQMVEWCKYGPPNAHVENVEVQDDKEEGLKDFSIKY